MIMLCLIRMAAQRGYLHILLISLRMYRGRGGVGEEISGPRDIRPTPFFSRPASGFTVSFLQRFLPDDGALFG